MTFVSFFGRDAIDNLATCLTGHPDRVIFIGENQEHMEKEAMRYRMILLGRGSDVEFICREVPKSDLKLIIEALSEICEAFSPCIFDLTGGDELYLVAAGIVYERYRDRGTELHRFSVRENRIIDCNEGGCTFSGNMELRFTVEENIRIYGGEVVYEGEKPAGTRRVRMTEELRSDLAVMWDICRKNVKVWNRMTSILASAANLDQDKPDPLRIAAPIPALLKELNKTGLKNERLDGIFKKLSDAGILTDYSAENDLFSYTVKNAEIRHCLTKAGQLLEYVIYAAGLSAKSALGNPVYNDVMTGVSIDWDGNIAPKATRGDTENEIDVILMRGLLPVFVSCKNGAVGPDELYKLSTVAERFGGRYAKKILVATALGDNANADYLRVRAKDMGIRVIEEAADYSLEEMEELVDSFRRG